MSRYVRDRGGRWGGRRREDYRENKIYKFVYGIVIEVNIILLDILSLFFILLLGKVFIKGFIYL